MAGEPPVAYRSEIADVQLSARDVSAAAHRGTARKDQAGQRSGGVAVVVAQQAAQSLAALHGPARPSDFTAGIDEPVLQSLVIPLGVVVFQELPPSRPKTIVQRIVAKVQAGM